MGLLFLPSPQPAGALLLEQCKVEQEEPMAFSVGECEGWLTGEREGAAEGGCVIK